MNRYSTYHSRWYSTYMIKCVCQAINYQLLLVSILCLTWAHGRPTVDPRNTRDILCNTYVYYLHLCLAKP